MGPAEWIALVSVLVAAGALFTSWRTSRRQTELAQEQTTLAKKQTDLAGEQNRIAREIHENERALSQRQAFIHLWPEISQLDEVDPDAPIEAAVLKAANALELVAIFWEAEAVDPDLIRRSFAEPYIKMYEDINRTGKLPKGIDGPAILRSAPAVGNLYRQLLREREEGRAIPRMRAPKASAERAEAEGQRLEAARSRGGKTHT